MPYSSVRDRYVNDGAGVVPQPRLLTMLYDRLVLDLENAIKAIGDQRLEVANDKLCHAQSILIELRSALDQNAWDGAKDLSRLYSWFHDQLMEGNVKKDSKVIRSSLVMIRQLQGAWHRAYDELMAGQAAPAATAVRQTSA